MAAAFRFTGSLPISVLRIVRAFSFVISLLLFFQFSAFPGESFSFLSGFRRLIRRPEDSFASRPSNGACDQNTDENTYTVDPDVSQTSAPVGNEGLMVLIAGSIGHAYEPGYQYK